MRILILALTLGLGLTLNAKEENSISKKDSIHFIDGVLIMANDTISVGEFIFFAESRSKRAAVGYLDRALQEMIYAEKPEQQRADAFPGVVAGILLGVATVVAGARLVSTSGDPRYVAGLDGCWFFCSGFREDFGGSLVGGGILIAGAYLASMVSAETEAEASGGAENANTPLTSSARHNLKANRLIDKAVNSYNKPRGWTRTL